MRILEAVTENAHGHWRKGSPKGPSKKALLGLATTKTATLDGHVVAACCRCMAGGLGCHHITLRPTRLPENRELVSSASSPAHQPETDKLRNMGQARELGGGRGDALKNARPALSADGLQGPSPLTGFWVAFFHDPVQHPSTFFFNDDMALRSLRVLDLVSSEWRQHFVRFEFFWSPDTQTRSFFPSRPGQ